MSNSAADVAESPSPNGGVAAAGFRAVANAARSFHPASMPLMARQSYRLELTGTFFLAITLATVDGGIISVITKKAFSDSTDPATLNMAVGIVGASAELANILSFGWSQLAHARPKVPLIGFLQLGIIIAIATIAFPLASSGPWALWSLVALVLLARLCWSGILTVRPTIWRANYPRGVRATVIGKFSSVQVLTIASVGILLGWIMDRSVRSASYMIPCAAALGLVSFFTTRSLRIRRNGALLRQEQADSSNILPPWLGPLIVWRVLRKDPDFARFMIWMFVLGFANIMVPPLLAITLVERFGVGYLASILQTSSIPALVMFLTIPLWARHLNRAHVVRFRATHSWIFVLSTGTITLATWLSSLPLMYVGAALQGVGLGGAALAWNLGHVDFAPPAQTSQYMATHVTLNGLRGLLAPLTAVSLYSALSRLELAPGHALATNAAIWLFALSMLLAVIGSAGFVSLHKAMRAKIAKVNRSE